MSYRSELKEAVKLADQVQIDKKGEKNGESLQKMQPKPEEKAGEIDQHRLERMKKAFKPTWLYDQIEGNGKEQNGKK